MLANPTIAQLLEADSSITGDDPWPPPLKFKETAAPDTDAANAQRFCIEFGRDLIFIRGLGWHRWTGSQWLENDHEADRCAQELGRLILQESISKTTEALDGNLTKPQSDSLRKEGEQLLKWARLTESSARMGAAMKHAISHLSVQPDVIDQDPDLLNCPNGILDTRSGELRKPRRCDLLTQLSGIGWNPSAKCPLWLSTLADIFPDQPNVIDYLQRYFGYCLTGSCSEQQMTIFWGVGRNGKSTIVNTIRAMLGTYSRQSPPDLLMQTSSSRHNELADLYRARLVTAAESSERGRLNENLVKSITGGDPIKGRKLYQDFIEFLPTHKLLLQTNHRPEIQGTDLGIWRRVHLVPFTHVIPADKCDKDRDKKLLAELPGILNWAMRGCTEWRRIGLKPPAEVREATDEYRRDQDVLADFISECCEVRPTQQVTAKAVYSRYEFWCQQSGERSESAKWLSNRLSELGVTKDRRGGNVTYYGIGLIQSGEQDARFA